MYLKKVAASITVVLNSGLVRSRRATRLSSSPRTKPITGGTPGILDKSFRIVISCSHESQEVLRKARRNFPCPKLHGCPSTAAFRPLKSGSESLDSARGDARREGACVPSESPIARSSPLQLQRLSMRTAHNKRTQWPFPS